MIATIERHWPLISLLLLIALVAALIFFSSASWALSILMLLLGPGMAIFFIAAREIRAYRAYQIDQAGMVRNIFFEALGLLLAVALAILLVQVVIGLVTPFVGDSLTGFVIVLVVAVLVGLGASWLVKATWGRLVKFQN